jgi:surfeit locus 1 family protein
LLIEGSDLAILVDRGWIPFEDFLAGNLDQYNEPGTAIVRGIIRRSEEKAEIGGRTDPVPEPGSGPLLAWNLVNVPGIASQVAYSFLPVYVQQAPEADWTRLPYRNLPDLDLTEGPHLGYAIQWFIFASILAIGYPLYVRKDLQSSSDKPARTEFKDQGEANPPGGVNDCFEQGPTKI